MFLLKDDLRPLVSKVLNSFDNADNNLLDHHIVCPNGVAIRPWTDPVEGTDFEPTLSVDPRTPKPSGWTWTCSVWSIFTDLTLPSWLCGSEPPPSASPCT